MFQVLGIAAFIAACAAEPPAPHAPPPRYSSSEAVSSQSFTRHDIPLSYQMTSTHPKLAAQAHRQPGGAPQPPPAHYAPVAYVTPTPAYPSPPPHQPAPPAAPHHQYTTPEYGARPESSPPRGLYTKVAYSPSENRPEAEFTQAYFLPKGSARPGEEQSGGARGSPQLTYYVMQPQAAPVHYRTPPVQHPTQVYQLAQYAPASHATSSGSHHQPQYASAQPEVDYSGAVPYNGNQAFHSGNSFRSFQNQGDYYNSYEPKNAPAIAKYSPALMKSQNIIKSVPVYFQSGPAFTKTQPSVVSVAAYTKSSQNYAQAAPVTDKAQYIETAHSAIRSETPPRYTHVDANYVQARPSYVQAAAPSYHQVAQSYSQAVPNQAQTQTSLAQTKTSPQYVETSPAYGQNTQLYAVPDDSHQYYNSQH